MYNEKSSYGDCMLKLSSLPYWNIHMLFTLAHAWAQVCHLWRAFTSSCYHRAVQISSQTAGFPIVDQVTLMSHNFFWFCIFMMLFSHYYSTIDVIIAALTLGDNLHNLTPNIQNFMQAHGSGHYLFSTQKYFITALSVSYS